MASGVTFFNLGRWKTLFIAQEALFAAVDAYGRYVWYQPMPYVVEDPSFTDAGTFLFVEQLHRVKEMDVLGRVLNTWEAADIGLDSFHHSVIELPSGNLLALSTELRTYEGCSAAAGGMEKCNLVGDVIVELTRKGDVVRRTRLLDLLDPLRFAHPYYYTPFWDLVYSGLPGGTRDWSHGNCLRFVPGGDSGTGDGSGPGDGTVLVSLANQSWVLDLDYPSGKLLWRFGAEGDFPLQGVDFDAAKPGTEAEPGTEPEAETGTEPEAAEGPRWFQRPHGIELGPGGTILLSDNGADVPDVPPRPVEYAISGEAGTASASAVETWTWNAGAFVNLGPGDADYLPNGNKLYLDGTRMELVAPPLLNPANPIWMRLVELAPAQAQDGSVGDDYEPVFDLEFRGTDEDGYKYMSTGVERLEDLYPPTFTVTETDGVAPAGVRDVNPPYDRTQSQALPKLLQPPKGYGPPGPAVSSLKLTKAWGNPLAGHVKLETEPESTCSLFVEDLSGSTEWSPGVESVPSKKHSFPVLGLKFGHSYRFRIAATSTSGGVTIDDSLVYQTPEYQADLPHFDVVQAHSDLMSPGVTLVSLVRWGTTMEHEWGRTVAVDAEGDVLWIMDLTCVDFHVTAEGTILCLNGMDYVNEYDFFGNLLASVNNSDVSTDAFHHAVYPLPNGNVAALGLEVRAIGGYPFTCGGLQTCNVVGDVIVEFTKNGVEVGSWSLLDKLDPYHFGEGFAMGYWDMVYPGMTGGTKDWSHGNSVVYDPTDDSFLVSLAVQDYVVKLSRATGEVLWRFGPEGDFYLTSGTWPSHQHSAMFLPDGHLMMFDNGTFKTPKQSRVVEYAIDASCSDCFFAGEQVFEFTDDQPFFSQIWGEVDFLANGNLLVTDSSRLGNPDGSEWDPANPKFARVVEITHTTPPQKVFELVVPKEAPSSSYGYWITKSERVVFPGLP